ncbi:MAG: transporter [Novosphingobium sp.]
MPDATLVVVVNAERPTVCVVSLPQRYTRDIMPKLRSALFLLPVAFPAPCFADEHIDAPAAELRDLCTERPGLTTAACTVDPGHLQVEIGLADWERDTDSDARQDQLRLSDVQLRYGLASRTELQMSWAPFVRTATRDFAAGSLTRSHGIGDVTIGLKQNLRHPQEKATGFAAAILPYVGLATGTNGAGDGDWSAGMVLPLSYKFSETVVLALSPKVEAEVDEDRSGRHLAYGAAGGLQFSISDNVRLSPELEVMRSRDPADHATLASAALSLA